MLSAPEERTIKAALEAFIARSDSMTALLVSRSGHGIAEAGQTEYLNSTGMAALVAAMFAATKEVARIVGEDQFSIMLQQGERRHIHISLVAGASMLVIVFEDYRRIGRVRHEARKTAERIAEVMKGGAARHGAPAGRGLPEGDGGETTTVADPEKNGTLSVPEFKEFALNLVDQLFASE